VGRCCNHFLTLSRNFKAPGLATVRALIHLLGTFQPIAQERFSRVDTTTGLEVVEAQALLHLIPTLEQPEGFDL
jgi:hypothetical protein